MKVLKIKPVRLLAAVTAMSLMFSVSTFAADLNRVQLPAPVNEGDAPIEVGSLVTGNALGMGTVVVAGVNVRENPNMDAAVTTVLSQFDQVVVLSKDGDWYRVSSAGLDGFVSCEYIALETVGYATLGYGRIKAAEAVAHVTADTASEVTLNLTEEDVLQITGIHEGWYEVCVNGQYGFIRSDLVDPTASIPANLIYNYAVVNVNGINLRSAPDAASEKLDMLYGNSLCTLLEQDGDWYKVQYGDSVGYVMASYMEATNDEAAGKTTLETQNEVIERQAAERAAAEEAAARAAAEEAARAQRTPAPVTGTAATYSEPSYVASTSYDDDDDDDYYDYSYDYSYDEPSYSYGSSSGSAAGQEIVDCAYQYYGTPYVWGGTTPAGFDCSGFTQYVFAQCGYSINRTADDQYFNGYHVSYSDLQPGDLVFFCNTYSEPGITHVGIYVGGGDFIHCAGSVKVSSLDEEYYSTRYYGATRVAG